MLQTLEGRSHLAEGEPQYQCLYQAYNPLLLPWETISDKVMTIEKNSFKEQAESEEKLRGIFHDPDSIVVTVRNPFYDMELVGFSAVIPAANEYSFPDCEFPERLTEGEVNLTEVLYVHCTQFAESHQGKKLVVPLNTKVLELVQAKRPDALYFERDAANTPRKGKATTYAQDLLAAYGDRVVKSATHLSRFGPQMFIRQLIRPLATALPVIH